MGKYITELLRNALCDIENLQDYYHSQKKYVRDYVDSNIEKNIYGVMIDRFFWKKMVNSDEIEITEKEHELINEILVEYSTEEKDNGYVVKYKLNPDIDYSGYEMDPQIAKANFIKLIQQPNILNESMIMMLLVKYEEAIAGVFHFLLEAYPEAYLSSKSITYAELVLMESNINEIKERYINKEIDEFMRLSFSEWYKSFESKQKIKFIFDDNDFDDFKEVYYRRNLIVHNQGIVNEIYKKNITNCSVELGKRLEVDEEYLTKAFSVAIKMIIGTIWGLRKTADDIDELNEFLFDYGYDCLKMEQWEIAEYIYGVLITDKKQQEIDILCEQVNMWIAKKNRKGLDVIKSEVEKLDVSAMQRQFVVAKYALLDDFDNVTTYLEETIDKDIPAWCVSEWPLLKQYRASLQYSTFVDKHKDLFETKGYEPNNETVGLTEEVIAELEDDVEREIAITNE